MKPELADTHGKIKTSFKVKHFSSHQTKSTISFNNTPVIFTMIKVVYFVTFLTVNVLTLSQLRRQGRIITQRPPSSSDDTFERIFDTEDDNRPKNAPLIQDTRSEFGIPLFEPPEGNHHFSFNCLQQWYYYLLELSSIDIFTIIDFNCYINKENRLIFLQRRIFSLCIMPNKLSKSYAKYLSKQHD